MSTVQEIINSFELYYDDGTALSSAEELNLFNKIYFELCSDRPWEILRKTHTDTTSTTVPYIALPSDFTQLSVNSNYSTSDMEANTPVVFVGTNYTPYKVVSFADRRQYRTSSGYCYIDIVNNRLYFTIQPTTAESIEFDYIHTPEALTVSDTPIFPSRFHPYFYHRMVSDNFIIEQSDKARSYAPENRIRAKEYLDSLCLWNSNLIVQ